MENSKVTRRSKLVTMEEAAGLVADGMMLAVGGNHSHEAPCAFARELVRRGVKDLTCVFDFDEETKQARLHSVHPGHTVEEVKAKTGFKPIIPGKVPETEPPTEAELAFLRAFDADRILPELC